MEPTTQLALWADLADLMCDPATPARTLEPTDGNNGARPRDEGKAGDLMRTAPDTVAVVAPIRSDLDAFDLDHCAEQVRPMLVDAAERVGGVLVYLATSGSEDSEHVVIGCPNHAARGEFLAQVDLIRVWSGAGDRVDHRHGAGGGFRLPGSVSLKSGAGHVNPITEAGRLMSPTVAMRLARKALKTVRLPLSAPAVRSSPHVAPGADSVGDAPRLVRAWKPRRQFSDVERLRLNTDGTKGDRSLTAIRAAWALWCVGIRSWNEAGDYYASRPAFAKFAARRDGGRKHWEREAARWAAYRGEVDQDDQDAVTAWLSEASVWTDHDAVAALVAVLVHRFTDGRGTKARPIARRDLAMWIGTSPETAGRRLRDLVEYGALVIARHWQDGPPENGTLYDLVVLLYDRDLTHKNHSPNNPLGLDPAVVLAPVWHVLGHPARVVWSELSDSSITTSDLAEALQMPIGNDTFGLRMLLARLESSGLAERVGRGRGTRWVRGAASLEDAAVSVGAPERLARLQKRIDEERALWHADTTAARDRVAEAIQFEMTEILVAA